MFKWDNIIENQNFSTRVWNNMLDECEHFFLESMTEALYWYRG